MMAMADEAVGADEGGTGMTRGLFLLGLGVFLLGTAFGFRLAIRLMTGSWRMPAKPRGYVMTGGGGGAWDGTATGSNGDIDADREWLEWRMTGKGGGLVWHSAFEDAMPRLRLALVNDAHERHSGC
jgi:hypothetical protein